MYRVLKRHKDNLPVIHDNWDDPTGCPPLLDNENFKEFISHVSKDSGKTFSHDEISKFIETTNNKKIINAGLVPILDSSIPSRSATANYRAMVAADPNITIATSAISKTSSRFSAETSLRSAISFLMVVSTTHFIVSSTIHADFHKKMKDSKTECGVRMMYSMTMKACDNLPLAPIKPQYILSTDDTVKLTFTFAAVGTCTPLFISVCGLTGREMPTDPSVII